MAKRWVIGEDRQLVEYGTQPFVWEPVVVLESDYDALARDFAACKIARDGWTKASDDAHARIRELETALTKIYGKASACDPSHYNQTMTEIIDIASSVPDRGSK